jgi:phosphatidylinositol-3-phosphatase
MKNNYKKVILFLPVIAFVGVLVVWRMSALKRDSGAITFPFLEAKFIHPDHIIFVWLENKEFERLTGADSSAPYINSLVKAGTLFTDYHAITHPSYPNYVDFFAGAANGITGDDCVNADTLTAPNLYTILYKAGKTFAWYSEGLPATGSKVCASQYYVAKHNPTSIFKNVPDGANKRFADLPADFNKLENVVAISPNLNNDMHDGSIGDGDAWIRKHLSALADWCMTHNSIFVIDFDESDSRFSNQVPVIVIGEHVKAGYKSNKHYNHFSWTKTISAMCHASQVWTSNVSDARVIQDCWK